MTPNAKRSKARRSRRDRGVRCVVLELPEKEFRAAMVGGGYIRRRDADDWQKLTAALQRLTIAIIGKLVARDTRVTASSPDRLHIEMMMRRESRGVQNAEDVQMGRGGAADAD